MFKWIHLFFSVVRPFTLVKWSAYLVICAVLWVWADFTTIQDYLDVRERRQNYENEVVRLKAHLSQQAQERTELQSGGFHLEKTIREKQFLVYPGEKIIFVQPPSTASSGPDLSPGLSFDED